MKKFQIGDRVKVKRKYIEWKNKNFQIYFTPSGAIEESDLKTIGVWVAAKHGNYDVKGEVTCFGADSESNPSQRNLGVSYSNEFGEGFEYFDPTNVVRLVKKKPRCKECGKRK